MRQNHCSVVENLNKRYQVKSRFYFHCKSLVYGVTTKQRFNKNLKTKVGGHHICRLIKDNKSDCWSLFVTFGHFCSDC